MSRTFYPSDEYDSFDLEQERGKRRSRLFKKRPWQRDDDDDSPPPAPAAAPLPKAPLPGGAALAA